MIIKNLCDIVVSFSGFCVNLFLICLFIIIYLYIVSPTKLTEYEK